MKRPVFWLFTSALLLAMLVPAVNCAAAAPAVGDDALTTVVDLTAVTYGSDVSLSWTHLGQAVDHYEVHGSSTPYFDPGGSSFAANVDGTSYWDSSRLFSGAGYYYAVVPIGSDGTRYPISNRTGVFISELNPTWVETHDRQAAQDFFLNQYLSSENVAAGWTGSHASCNPGVTSAAFRTAILNRINYFRAMGGIPNLRSLSDNYTGRAQEAALMMSVNRQLSHSPPTTWTCYTAGGAQAAGSSNLYLGAYGPAAISGYIMDPGAGNYPVGHRRWILYPPTQQMGTGDIPPAAGYPSSNDLWVFDFGAPRPLTREPYVAWPPPGYVPYPAVFARWSFSLPDADFSAATVTMQSGGAAVPVSLQPVVNGYGENTLVWAPAGASGNAWPKPAEDTRYSVTVQNVLLDDRTRSFTYEVIVFDPLGSASIDALVSLPEVAPGPAPR